ncbi:hypothetical protein RHA1_ro07054 [Rhodococcus jostii RHA1]|uniref:Uncharacterized protein n=1 Tax=Rhodococcus jostii (strain RHA1) TaxID=101510 RepID=Q0S0W6_RHOJR|nr:hypothetical protein RHA1_ro07054 [Rhodococcus jostii RHA1]
MPIASHSSVRNATRVVFALESVIACLSHSQNQPSAAPVSAGAHRFHPRAHPRHTARRQGGNRHPGPAALPRVDPHPVTAIPASISGNRPDTPDQQHLKDQCSRHDTPSALWATSPTSRGTIVLEVDAHSGGHE